MSQENVRKFDERLNGDEALQTRLQELMEAFDGDRDDSKAVFESVVSPLAEEVGLPYTYDEALEYVAQRDDDEDLTADEVKAVAGGERGMMVVCCIIGFGGVNADACFNEYSGVGVCAGVGAGSLVL